MSFLERWFPKKEAKPNGSGGHPPPIELPPGVIQTERAYAAQPGEFPTPTPAGQGGRSPALQPRNGGNLFQQIAYADPYRLFPQGFNADSPSFAYNPNALIAKKGYFTIDEMRRDEQVKAALTFKKQAVIAAGWAVEPPEGKEEDDEATEFIRDNLRKLEGSFERTTLEILTALDYGFSITEPIYEERDGKVWLKALKVRRPHTFEFAQNAFGDVLGLRQQNRDLPIEKFVIYSYDYEFSNPYGRTDLEACYRPWWTKRNAYMWLAMLLERLGIPPIFALYNPNDYPNTQRAEMQNILKNLQAATVGTIPRPNEDSLEFWSPELAGQVSEVFLPAMDWFDKNISRALLMPGLMGMTSDDGDTGSLARSRVHFDVFLLVLERIRAEVGERVVQEQIIDPLYALNFGAPDADVVPRFKFLPLTDDLRTEILTAWQGLLGAGAVTATDEDERHMRQLFEFPEFDPEAGAERATRKSEEAAENLRRSSIATGKLDQEGNPIPAAGPPGKKPPEDEDEDEEDAKRFHLTDAQFERVLEDLRRSAGA